MQLIVITGLSGAGKGLATRHFEDFGYFCVDNLPPMLIASFAELLERGKIGKAALVVDVRGGEFFSELMGALDALEQSTLELKILFLDCDDDALIKRFKETRRKHPLDGDADGLPAAIERERELLVPLRARADKVINTSRVTPRELRDELQRTFVEADDAPGMLIQVESFGFKHGPHAGADLVFDVRFLPNPNYDRDIGHLDGFSQPIIDYVLAPDVTREFLRRWEEFLLFLIPQFEAEGKAYLTIAVGCTGGRHRSVALTNWLTGQLDAAGYRVAASHRDLAAHAPADLSEPENTLPNGDAPAGASLSRAQSQTFELPRDQSDGSPDQTSVSPDQTLISSNQTKVSRGQTKVSDGQTLMSSDPIKVSHGQTSVSPAQSDGSPDETLVSPGEAGIVGDAVPGASAAIGGDGQ